MSSAKIHGAEFPVGKIFSREFVFSIPPYQRPYSWTEEHAKELIDDLLMFMGNSDNSIDSLNPYFLGSIVLIKSESPDSQVVDGQQRLTTLTILFAALRAVLTDSFANSISKAIYEEGDPAWGTPDRPRLTLRPRDHQFFEKFIQDSVGFEKLSQIDPIELSDPQKNLRKNALLFVEELNKLTMERRKRLVQFIVTKCFLIVVSTPDFESAYRIFSVLNDRGMDLSPTDILKSEIIGNIHVNQREKYTNIWEETEENLGRDGFVELFTHIRMIIRKRKAAGILLKEYREHIKPTQSPKAFIDDLLIPYAKSFDQIHNSTFESSKNASEINELFRWLNKIDNSDWVPAAIFFLSKYRGDHDNLFKFFKKLERLAAGMMIYRANINERIQRYSKVLQIIENESLSSIFDNDSPLQLTEREKGLILEQLSGDIYTVKNVPRYVLLRLDSLISEGEAFYEYPIISIEHVLPQNPKEDSHWVEDFPDFNTRWDYVHKLGNLVLLSKRKNSQARNYDFEKKKSKYFAARQAVTSFAITSQVMSEDVWTKEVITRRQNDLLDLLGDYWELT